MDLVTFSRGTVSEVGRSDNCLRVTDQQLYRPDGLCASGSGSQIAVVFTLYTSNKRLELIDAPAMGLMINCIDRSKIQRIDNFAVSERETRISNAFPIKSGTTQNRSRYIRSQLAG